MLRKGATFTLPTKYRDSTLCKIRGLNTTRNKVWRFQPRHLCLTLQLKVSVITLRRKSARRSIVYLIPYVENFQSARRTNKNSRARNPRSTTNYGRRTNLLEAILSKLHKV